MMKRAALVLLVACGLLSGCALSSALDRADALERQGQFRAALDQCERARRIDPESDEAHRCVERVRPHAIRQAMADARAAFDAGDFPDAVDNLNYVDSQLRYTDRDSHRRQEESVALRNKIHRVLRERLDEALAADDYGRALDTLDTISRCELDRAREIDRRKADVRAEWGASLVEQAESHESQGHQGAALVLYLSADHVAEHAVARTQAERLVRALRDEARYRVCWRAAGPQAHVSTLEAQVEDALDELPRTERVQRESISQLAVEIQLDAIACDQERVGSKELEQEYVAGTVEVENPTYTTLVQRLDELGVDITTVRRRIDRRRTRYEERKQELEVHRQQTLQPLVHKLQNVSQRVQLLGSNVEQAQNRLADAEAQLERLEAEQASQDAISAQRDIVDKLTAELGAEHTKLDKASGRYERLETSHEQALQTDQRLEEALTQAETALDEAIDEEEAALAKRQRLEARLQKTPKRVDKEVTRTFKYKAAIHQRHCRGQMTLALGDHKSAETSQAVHSTRDEAHRGYRKYGVEEDPLEFPKSDEELRALVVGDFADRAASTIAAHRRAYYAGHLDRARKAMVDRPHEATDLWLATFLTSPGELTQSDVDALSEHLQRHYGASPLKSLSEM